jgi:hypothetical protein
MAEHTQHHAPPASFRKATLSPVLIAECADMRQIYGVVIRPLDIAWCLLLIAQRSPVRSRVPPCQPFGGQQAVDALFEHELHFPDDALAEGIDGISTLIFTVEADGTLRDLRYGSR